MRIAHVLDSLDVGGAEVMATSLSKMQREMGHSVTVHCLYRLGPLAECLRELGIQVFLHGPAPIWKKARSLYGYFRQLAPDVVHCHNAAATILSAAIAKAAGARAVVSTRHGLVDDVKRRYQERKYAAAAAFFCDRIVAVCEASRCNLARWTWGDKSRIVTIRNGAAPAPMGTSTDSPSRDNGFTIVNVARLVSQKDHATLLRATALASREINDLKLLLVGGGPDEPQLRSLADELFITNRVSFLGERADVGRYLRQSDLFVLSSATEGLPISLLEAMAAGKPAVTTKVGGMPEVIDLSGAGSVVEAQDPESLARCIVSYAQSRSDLELKGKRARAAYEKHFTPERMTIEYLQLYEACLRENNRS